ncbi:hypothetical protein GQR58_029673 [Nymphon striatum]|nr:hypothetical protein GQR58_029673 [Nymphon striatum]
MALTDPAFDGPAFDTSAVGFGAAAEAQPVIDAPAPERATQPNNILDPGFDLTLRPMRYPQFFDMYRDAIKNTWTVDEIDLSDLDNKLTPGRASPGQPSGCVLRYRRLDRGQQPGAEPVHAHQCARSSHVPVTPALRRSAARAVLPDAARQLHPRHGRAPSSLSLRSRTSRRSSRRLTSASSTWAASTVSTELNTKDERRQFLMNLICFRHLHRGPVLLRSVCLRVLPALQGLLNGSADWHQLGLPHMNFALEVVNTVRAEEPDLIDDAMNQRISDMIGEAVDCEYLFAEDLLSEGVTGMSLADTRTYLEFVGRPALGHARLATSLRRREPVCVHGTARRSAALELLRAHRVVVPSWHRRNARQSFDRTPDEGLSEGSAKIVVEQAVERGCDLHRATLSESLLKRLPTIVAEYEMWSYQTLRHVEQERHQIAAARIVRGPVSDVVGLCSSQEIDADIDCASMSEAGRTRGAMAPRRTCHDCGSLKHATVIIEHGPTALLTINLAQIDCSTPMEYGATVGRRDAAVLHNNRHNRGRQPAASHNSTDPCDNQVTDVDRGHNSRLTVLLASTLSGERQKRDGPPAIMCAAAERPKGLHRLPGWLRLTAKRGLWRETAIGYRHPTTAQRTLGHGPDASFSPDILTKKRRPNRSPSLGYGPPSAPGICSAEGTPANQELCAPAPNQKPPGPAIAVIAAKLSPSCASYCQHSEVPAAPWREGQTALQPASCAGARDEITQQPQE